jgi:hypothetical protein
VKLIERLVRLWQLSSPDVELISREEYKLLMDELTQYRRETKDMNERISDWIGTLMKSELLRRELEEENDRNSVH